MTQLDIDADCSTPGGPLQASAASTGVPTDGGEPASLTATAVGTPGPTQTPKSAAKEAQAQLVELLKEYGNGSLMRGWRREFDQEGHMEVEYMDFIKEAARLNFTGDAQLLFGMDDDMDSLSLSEVSEPDGLLMEAFKGWVKDEFGSPEAMFKAFDKGSTGKISQEAFLDACRRHGFQQQGCEDEDVKLVYECCDVADVGSITQDDVIFLEQDANTRSQNIFKAKASNKKAWQRQLALEFLENSRSMSGKGGLPPSHRLAPRPWAARMFESMPAVASHLRNERAKDHHARLVIVREAFMKELRKVHGHEARAFRKGLDPDGGMSFGQTKLRSYCRSLGLSLNLVDLWGALDGDHDGQVRFEELCTPYALALGSLKTWARKLNNLGSTAAIMDSPEMVEVCRRRLGIKKPPNRIDSDVLEEALKDLGWPGARDRQTRRYALKALDLDGVKQITRTDLQWVDSWLPLEYVCVEPDYAAWGQLRQTLVGIYGHPLRAWRCLLDMDDQNVVSWTEWKQACYKLKFGLQRAAGAWRALDEDMSGTVTMREFDLDSCLILKSFKDWAESFFGSVKECWQGIDKDRSGTVSYTELKRACHRLHWTGDARLLFDCLDTDGKRGGFGGERALSVKEVEFLDNWLFEPSREDIQAQVDIMKRMRVKKPKAEKTGPKMTESQFSLVLARLQQVPWDPDVRAACAEKQRPQSSPASISPKGLAPSGRESKQWVRVFDEQPRNSQMGYLRNLRISPLAMAASTGAAVSRNPSRQPTMSRQPSLRQPSKRQPSKSFSRSPSPSSPASPVGGSSPTSRPNSRSQVSRPNSRSQASRPGTRGSLIGAL